MEACRCLAECLLILKRRKKMTNKYVEEVEQAYTMMTVMEEAQRCLLCHDAPCSKSCPAGTDPARFIRSVRFRNFKGAAETIRENNALASLEPIAIKTASCSALSCSKVTSVPTLVLSLKLAPNFSIREIS